ncbi:hypothetical protein BS47DRAFT_1433638 [Hydnum rufescens UP504]|uniref:NAD-dependent epimerase/dehydratase domain-containing protein n=1 Tax=Hydnum rufescens UP504 TaxID=1448309 RepID=A0A9P6B4C9_9AGAM|nr:hypothetical protein BS47DRAFT_1433638 [Hydnum rufescens UP504]
MNVGPCSSFPFWVCMCLFVLCQISFWACGVASIPKVISFSYCAYEAVKDVDGIIHAASPVILKWDNPEEVLRPAIRGALGILESARKYGKNVKRIVLTSSGAAIGMPIERDGKMTVWNTLDTAQFEALGKNSSPLTVYFASKTYAEQSSPASLTLAVALAAVGKSLGRRRYIGTYTNDCADVRDTADFHLLALENPDASGERVLIGPDSFAWQDIYDIFHSAGFPNVDVPGKSTRGAGKLKAPTVTSTAKAFKLWPTSGIIRSRHRSGIWVNSW